MVRALLTLYTIVEIKWVSPVIQNQITGNVCAEVGTNSLPVVGCNSPNVSYYVTQNI
jgi:hypothetical protein